MNLTPFVWELIPCQVLLGIWRKFSNFRKCMPQTWTHFSIFITFSGKPIIHFLVNWKCDSITLCLLFWFSLLHLLQYSLGHPKKQGMLKHVLKSLEFFPCIGNITHSTFQLRLQMPCAVRDHVEQVLKHDFCEGGWVLISVKYSPAPLDLYLCRLH